MTSPITGPTHSPSSRPPMKRRRLCSPEEAETEIIAFKHVALPKPRSQIRILRLHTGEQEAELACDLNQFDLENTPQYRAISYTWGSHLRTKRLIVNDHYLMVGENCYYSLWQARLHGSTPLLLWIDCICIDQSNKTEKSHQVGMIDRIFANATSTFACVGPEQDNSSHLLRQTELMHTAIVPTHHKAKKGCTLCNLMLEDNWTERPCVNGNDPVHGIHEWVQSLSVPGLERLAVALQHFSERPYWTRVWIQPEMAMSAEVRILCGDQLAMLDGLRWLVGLFRCIENRLDDLEPEIHPLQVLKKDRLPPQFELSGAMCQVMMFHLMRHIGPLGPFMAELESGFECYKRHDMFYAARSLLDWDPHFDVVTVDYNKSTVDFAVEILPHLTRYGVPFPSNIEILLQLLSYDPAKYDVDRRDMTRLQAVRIDHHWPITEGLFPGPHEPCSCASALPSRIAIWVCDMLTTRMVYGSDIGQGFGTFFPSESGLKIAVEAGDHKEFSHLLQRYRPENCLSVVGLDTANDRRDVIGIVTSEARSGDILIDFPGASDYHLVLRWVFDDIYGIVGYAVIGSGVKFAVDDEPVSAVEPRDYRNMDPEPQLSFDFWFDAEDALAHVLNVLNVKSATDPTQMNPKMLNLVCRSFTRTKFSSFATVCFGIKPEEKTYCPECATGYTRRICIHCGGSMGTPGSPYFRQDPIDRLPFVIPKHGMLEPLDTVALPRRASAEF